MILLPSHFEFPVMLSIGSYIYTSRLQGNKLLQAKDMELTETQQKLSEMVNIE